MITTRIIRVSVRTAAVASVVFPLILSAQAAPPSVPDSGWQPHVRVGAGTLSGVGPMGLVGVDVSRPGSRLSVRASVDYSQRDVRFRQDITPDGTPLPASACTTYCLERRTKKIGGLTIDARFDLLTGRFRPYVLTGFGFYRSVDTNYANADCSSEEFTCVLTPGQIHPNANRSFPIALQGGVGASFRVGRAELFGEMSTRALGSSYRSGYGDWFKPMMVGIRF